MQPIPYYEEEKPVYNMWKQVATIMLRGVHTTPEQKLHLEAFYLKYNTTI